MVRTHPRSPSPEPSSSGSLLKRLKTTHSPESFDPIPHFAQGVLDAPSVQKLHDHYVCSEPFKYAVVERLFDDGLLRGVKDECLRELCFTEKETDIYKVCSIPSIQY
jgi:prolyl 3-hydroxylase /prolyl 3,4-dihydroxylase